MGNISPETGSQRERRTEATVNDDQLKLFTDVARLDHMSLIEKVVNLAYAVRDGDGHQVDDLVVHCRVLDHRYQTRKTGYPRSLATTTRLSEMRPRGLAAQTRDDPKVMTMNMVIAKSEGQPRYVTTTAGYIRDVFGGTPTPIHRWLGGMGLATLPGDIPGADDTPVVLYGTLQGGACRILSAVRDRVDPGDAVEHITGRIVRHEPFPWESGWTRD